ncbi:phospholipase D-like domain-containing protein [Actinoplanes utahensis]|uniref:phospholipase D-like domain-containing protein n=1 Tax=Actinoplanes utahensis TaxID=1869 RepID=UPI00068C93D4|nr:phospholipase D-like domain-containing protein [Actinoplanes utahensis]GIF30932.1 hypothetical protein Aut01nite_39180 [Actinoplanes utahensis]
MRRHLFLRAGTALALTTVTLSLPTAAMAEEEETVEAAAVSSAGVTIGGHPVWAHFNNPPAFSNRDHTITNELIRLINAAPATSTIRGTIHSLSIPAVANALVNAQNRNVNVSVVIDGKNKDLDTTNNNTAVKAIKTLTNHRFCTYGDGRACISTSADGDMHTKMFTFSTTADPNGVTRNNVSWFGSANLTYATGPDSFNNTITVYGDTALYNGFNANFTDMWNRRHYTDNDYYDAASGRGYYQAAAADAYASPEQAGETDTIVTRLNDATPDANCRLRIGMSFVTSGRPGLVSLVKRFKSAGCQIWMVVGTKSDTDPSINMTESVYQDLLGAGIKIRKKAKVHDKFFALYAKFGTTYQYRVYTGSQNWSADALTDNEEIFVKMAPEPTTSHPLYNAFYNHFNDAYNNGTACAASNPGC